MNDAFGFEPSRLSHCCATDCEAFCHTEHDCEGLPNYPNITTSKDTLLVATRTLSRRLEVERYISQQKMGMNDSP